ncbi:hypothetical protein J3B00_003134 [Pseudomonas sp. BP8]|nr:hypothetical protein [Pseudomonas sp. BP8]
MDQITQLDISIGRVSRIADELEQQVAPCPASRLRFVTWVTDLVGNPSRLAEIEQALPSIPQCLVSAYTAWVHAAVCDSPRPILFTSLSHAVPER